MSWGRRGRQAGRAGPGATSAPISANCRNDSTVGFVEPNVRFDEPAGSFGVTGGSRPTNRTPDPSDEPARFRDRSVRFPAQRARSGEQRRGTAGSSDRAAAWSAPPEPLLDLARLVHAHSPDDGAHGASRAPRAGRERRAPPALAPSFARPDRARRRSPRADDDRADLREDRARRGFARRRVYPFPIRPRDRRGASVPFPAGGGDDERRDEPPLAAPPRAVLAGRVSRRGDPLAGVGDVVRGARRSRIRGAGGHAEARGGDGGRRRGGDGARVPSADLVRRERDGGAAVCVAPREKRSESERVGGGGGDRSDARAGGGARRARLVHGADAAGGGARMLRRRGGARALPGTRSSRRPRARIRARRARAARRAAALSPRRDRRREEHDRGGEASSGKPVLPGERAPRGRPRERPPARGDPPRRRSALRRVHPLWGCLARLRRARGGRDSRVAHEASVARRARDRAGAGDVRAVHVRHLPLEPPPLLVALRDRLAHRRRVPHEVGRGHARDPAHPRGAHRRRRSRAAPSPECS